MITNIYINFIVYFKAKPFSCQLVLLDNYPNEIIQQQLSRLDSSLILFKQINSCLDYFQTVTHPVILITVNTLGQQIVPKIHSHNQLRAVFIYDITNDERTKWTISYDKVNLLERKPKNLR
jgi:hypothetical protein